MVERYSWWIEAFALLSSSKPAARSILPLQRVFLHEKVILCSVWQSLLLPWKI
jgi:hypothetical protein